MTRSNSKNYLKIAYRWAPINYQYVNFGNPKRDMICAVNFDGDWNTKNNRRNLQKVSKLEPVVYYSIAETTTHYFILYCFYHADDYSHENDLEGCLEIIKKQKNQNDKLLGMISVAHMDFWSFVVGKRLKKGKETIDGKLQLEKYDGEYRSMIKQEPDKHGLYAWGSRPKWGGWGLPHDKKSNVGIRYVPGKKTKPVDPNKITTFEKTEAKYKLVEIVGSDGFWNRRNNKKLFRKWGTFASTTWHSANAPWVWKDHNDGLTPGLLFYDPAAIAARYFAGFDKYDNQYVKTMITA